MKKIFSNLKKTIISINKKKNFSLHSPLINKEDFKYLQKTILSTNVSSASNFTIDFEKKISKFTGSKYVIATNSGSSALLVAIQSIGLKPQEEIFVPNLNYIASTNAVILSNMTPHFIDCEQNIPAIDIKKLENHIKKECFFKRDRLINKKTKKFISAIIPTHVFGSCNDLEKLIVLSKKYNLKIIEDASEALGSFYKKKHLGTIGNIGVLSFNGNKIITTGGGGAILTNNKKIYNKALHLTKISRNTKIPWLYDYDGLGYNFRMPGINASLGLSQLKKIRNILYLKKKIFKNYSNKFNNNDEIEILKPHHYCKSNYWLNNIRIKNLSIKNRDNIIKSLNNKKIQVRPVWKLMSKIKYLKKYPHADLNNSIKMEKELISLPSSPDLITR